MSREIKVSSSESLQPKANKTNQERQPTPEQLKTLEGGKDALYTQEERALVDRHRARSQAIQEAQRLYEKQYQEKRDATAIRDIKRSIGVEEEAAAEQQKKIPRLSNHSLQELAGLSGIKVDALKEIGTKQEFIRQFAKALYDGLDDAQFGKPIQDVLRGIREDKQIETLFALTSAPDAVSLADLARFPQIKKFVRFKTHKEGYGVIPKILNDTRQLNCAGRTLVVSKALTLLNIDHYVLSPMNHSFIIIKKDAQNNTYFDPQQGLLFDFPTDALTISGDTAEGALGAIDVDSIPSAHHQDIGYVHKNFICFTPEVGVSEQALSNMIVGASDRWVPDIDPLLSEKLGEVRDALFPNFATDAPDNPNNYIDTQKERVEELLVFLKEAVKTGWRADEKTLRLVQDLELYGLTGETDKERLQSLQELMKKLSHWKSHGEEHELAEMLVAISGKPNKKGAGLNYFFMD